MMNYDNVYNEITLYLTYLAKREILIKNWEIRPDVSGVSITIHSIHDDFVRNTIAYDCPTLTIRRMLAAMVDELKVTGERNRMIRQHSTYDIELTKRQFDRYFTLNTNRTAKERADNYIEKVIFNPPATIVFFKDGQKVVVKRQEDDDWDEEKALAMAIVKHDHGLSVFNNALKKAERRYPDSNISIDMPSLVDYIASAAETIMRIFGRKQDIERTCKNCRFNELMFSSTHVKEMPFCTSDNPMINHNKSIHGEYEGFCCADFEPKEEEK